MTTAVYRAADDSGSYSHGRGFGDLYTPWTCWAAPCAVAAAGHLRSRYSHPRPGRAEQFLHVTIPSLDRPRERHRPRLLVEQVGRRAAVQEVRPARRERRWHACTCSEQAHDKIPLERVSTGDADIALRSDSRTRSGPWSWRRRAVARRTRWNVPVLGCPRHGDNSRQSRKGPHCFPSHPRRRKRCSEGKGMEPAGQ